MYDSHSSLTTSSASLQIAPPNVAIKSTITDQTSGPRLAVAHIAVAAIAGGPVAAQIAVAAIAGRCHLPSPPVRHRWRSHSCCCRRERKKNQTILTQSITLRLSLHDRRRRCSVAAASQSGYLPVVAAEEEDSDWATALF
ncbi:hypothetical protein MRB53_011008 [Persea americana]|uniref:Uncharacterized protein n=1 Tax=Persea americana TaxID=3435 RepID=A0ACC2LUK0_PERAE|nr:hypothetical protein MRB53_011008 [Persea americana]